MLSPQVDLLKLATLFCIYVVNNLPLVFVASNMLLQLLFMVLLVVMMFSSYIVVIFYEQLDVFVGRQVHRHLIDCIPKRALNIVFDSALIEMIVPMLLRGG